MSIIHSVDLIDDPHPLDDYHNFLLVQLYSKHNNCYLVCMQHGFLPHSLTFSLSLSLSPTHTHTHTHKHTYTHHPHSTGVILVTDAIAAAGLVEGIHKLGRLAVDVKYINPNDPKKRRGSAQLAGTCTLAGRQALYKCVVFLYVLENCMSKRIGDQNLTGGLAKMQKFMYIHVVGVNLVHGLHVYIIMTTLNVHTCL